MNPKLIIGGFATAVAGAGIALAASWGGEDSTPAETLTQPLTSPPATASPTDLADPWKDVPPLHSSKYPLWDIQLDAARQLGAEPLNVRLVSLHVTTWDGCIGVRAIGGACTAQAISGYVAIFDAPGKRVTYHVGGYQWVGPVDGIRADVSDGFRFDSERAVDVNAILADYVRREHALRLGIEPAAVTIENIIPTTFFNRCLGFSVPPPGTNENCDLDTGERFPGAFVALSSGDGREWYSVSTAGTVWLDRSRGTGRQQPSMNVGEIQYRMRQDLAQRRGVALEAVSMVSYRDVTWGDSCLGARKPGEVCVPGAVRGFVARLQAVGEDEEYHGTAADFVDAWAGGRELSAPTFDP